MAKKPLITPSESKVGQVLDLVRHAIRKSGVSYEGLQQINERGGDFQEEITPIIRRFAAPPPTSQRDMREGWELIEDTERTIVSVNLELVSFLKKGEDYINGEELVRRARKELRANLGQHDAEWLLEHQEEIPEEFRNYYLVFTGTIWRGRIGSRSVPDLLWRDGRWSLGFSWLDDGFGGSGRLVRLRE